MDGAKARPVRPEMPQPSSRTADAELRMAVFHRGLLGEVIHSANMGVIFHSTARGRNQSVRYIAAFISPPSESQLTSTSGPTRPVRREDGRGLMYNIVPPSHGQLQLGRSSVHKPKVLRGYIATEEQECFYTRVSLSQLRDLLAIMKPPKTDNKHTLIWIIHLGT